MAEDVSEVSQVARVAAEPGEQPAQTPQDGSRLRSPHGGTQLRPGLLVTQAAFDPVEMSDLV